jgi:hypothetical protein
VSSDDFKGRALTIPFKKLKEMLEKQKTVGLLEEGKTQFHHCSKYF